LGEVDEQRVNLLNQGQLGRFTLAHQGAFGHQSAANAPGDGCGDRCITQVDARALNSRFAHGDVGLGLLLRRLGCDKLLLADGLGLGQGLEALGLRTGLHQVGFGLGLLGLGAGKNGLVGAGVNVEQGLPGLDLAALHKAAFLQNTRHPRPHLGHA